MQFLKAGRGKAEAKSGKLLPLAPKGIHLVDPDLEILYEVSHRLLHGLSVLTGRISVDRSTRLLAFMDETIIYFLARSENVDRDIRNILDKAINRSGRR